MDWGAFILTAIGAVGLDRLIIYLDQRRAQRRKAEAEADQTGAGARKTDAEADNLQADAWQKAFNNLEKSLTGQIKYQEMRIGELGRDVADLKCSLANALDRITYLMDGIRQLHGQIHSANLNPVWTPNDWRPAIASDAFYPAPPLNGERIEGRKEKSD